MGRVVIAQNKPILLSNIIDAADMDVEPKKRANDINPGASSSNLPPLLMAKAIANVAGNIIPQPIVAGFI